MQVAVILDGYYEVGGAGTGCHMGGRVDFTLCSQCQALGQALILCCQGRGIRLVGLDCCYPAMWILALRQYDGPREMWCGVFRFLALLGMTR